MPRNSDDIESSLIIPSDIAEPAMKLVQEQDAARGDWDNPRQGETFQPPWPERGDPALRYLLFKFDAFVDAGIDPKEAAVTLAAHAWLEGGIANYDRGQRDARSAIKD
jgi:hypothetical protein